MIQCRTAHCSRVFDGASVMAEAQLKLVADRNWLLHNLSSRSDPLRGAAPLRAGPAGSRRMDGRNHGAAVRDPRINYDDHVATVSSLIKQRRPQGRPSRTPHSTPPRRTEDKRQIIRADTGSRPSGRFLAAGAEPFFDALMLAAVLPGVPFQDAQQVGPQFGRQPVQLPPQFGEFLQQVHYQGLVALALVLAHVDLLWADGLEPYRFVYQGRDRQPKRKIDNRPQRYNSHMSRRAGLNP
jgi:hypothetical protein